MADNLFLTTFIANTGVIMETIEELISALELAVPELDAQVLRENLPESDAQEDVLNWLYESLSAQGLMDYVEWTEYFGDIPDLKSLEHISFPESPSALILSQVENIDWDEVSVDPYMLPYELPYLEYINHFLTEKGLRLVDLTPFENAYIFCIRDDEEIMEKLDGALNIFEMGINEREPMDKEETKDYIRSLIE
ncbi:hypothetical protein KC966_05440 [Proteus terrae]|uniref:Uncharacterized protein n=2 Tax=Proteus terrae subsp. cibarius TaxID=626774 RepID=A0A8I0WP22_9GAMM|nr:hypothetical protein [Proteus terrae subsp. cibarius]MBG3089953.1 hypothetical protein [Proteus terrae subsp. cibarius]QUT00510.1 hypothetical protein KF949_12040 [Proteus terrae subsp. cibarius]UAX00702.1 hypothetical protein KDN45_11770 [Proteus terrae subsp. cibarius]